MTTFEVTAAQADESRELREMLRSLFPGAHFDRLNSTCFNVSTKDSGTAEALEELLDACGNKNGRTSWRLV